MKANKIFGIVLMCVGFIGFFYNFFSESSSDVLFHQMFYSIRICANWLSIIAGILIYQYKGTKK